MENNSRSLLDKIPQSSHFYYYHNEWANGRDGTITDSNGYCVYRFFESVRNPDGSLRDVERDYEDYEKYPIVATGFIGYWLHYRDCKNPIASLMGPAKKNPKNYLQQFVDYTNDKLGQYISREEKKPSSWRRDLKREFYTEFIIPNEMLLNKQTEALFEYITPEDCQIVKEVMSEYIAYLKKSRSDMGYCVTPELLVLRAAETQNPINYEDLEPFEINVTLDKLEKEGYVRVAWVEGHQPEDVLLLDKGRVYLKQLENALTNQENEDDEAANVFLSKYNSVLIAKTLKREHTKFNSEKNFYYVAYNLFLELNMLKKRSAEDFVSWLRHKDMWTLKSNDLRGGKTDNAIRESLLNIFVVIDANENKEVISAYIIKTPAQH